MSHENSETIQKENGKWINISGHTGSVLEPKLPTEQWEYDTVEMAVSQAKLRSQSFDDTGMLGEKKTQKKDTLTADEQQTIIALLKAGFEMNDIPAIMGNIAVETGDSFSHLQEQDGGSGYGLFQFDGGHKGAYLKWLESSQTPDSKYAQAKFVYDNIYGEDNRPYDLGWKARGLLQDAFAGDSNEDKTTIFSNVYERPGKPHMDRRQASSSKYKGMLGV